MSIITPEGRKKLRGWDEEKREKFYAFLYMQWKSSPAGSSERHKARYTLKIVEDDVWNLTDQQKRRWRRRATRVIGEGLNLIIRNGKPN